MTSSKQLLVITTSATSVAIPVPAPIAIPTSAAMKEGEVVVPASTIATT